MTALTDERHSRRRTLAALAGGLAALLPWRAVGGAVPDNPAADTRRNLPLRPIPRSRGAAQPAVRRALRGKWEYALYDLQTVQATRYNAFFDELGNDDWELVSMAPFTPIGSKDGAHVLVTFKRPK
jgi:hypothetical protein